MPSIFNTLHIGYSGLSVAQSGIDTTGHNISNAESDGYTRQRVVTAAAPPVTSNDGQVGNGATITEIKRVFDNFVFDRFTSISADKEYSDYEKRTLEELSTYFPEIDEVGIKTDLKLYYDMWQTFSDNPDNDSIKLALAKQTETLSDHIIRTQEKIISLQSQVNTQLEVNINEVNAMAKELATINNAIDVAESGSLYSANDLRDKRNVIERDLARLIGAQTSSATLQSNINIDSSANTKTGSYTLNVSGFNLVDGNSYHPIHISNEKSANGFYEVSYERQDGVLLPMTDFIKGGKIGSILNLRGGSIDTTSGMPTNGVIQTAISQLNAFAKGLIESTNNIYAKNSTDRMESNILEINPTNSLVNSALNISEGSFNIVVYDLDGNIAAKREVNIDVSTSMLGIVGSNSIEGQIKSKIDDNNDLNANNDIDDFIQFNWATYASGDTALELAMDPLYDTRGYTFAIEDVLTDATFSSGTNFAGALGLRRYFDGDSATTIALNQDLQHNPTRISAGYAPNAGDNRVALDMIQHQFENYDYIVGDQVYETTAYGMYDLLATQIGTETNSAIFKNETITSKYNATELEYSTVSKVSIDEEMTNLIKYQTSYGAAAKVITTIDQMMQTLLGIKQ